MISVLHTLFIAVIIVLFLVFQFKNIVDALKSSNRVWLWNSVIIAILGIVFFIFYFTE